MQRALAQVWRYFEPSDYAETVLQDAPLDKGEITVELVEHIPYLRILQHLRDVSLKLFDAGMVDDLVFLSEAPSATTSLQVQVRGPIDLSLLARCPALDTVYVLSGRVRAGLEIFAALPKLKYLLYLPSR